MTSESLRFDAGEVELVYKHWPGDSPPVLFLHGITGSKGAWESRADLRGKQEAYVYDARGHGDSARAKSYKFSDFGRDALRFLQSVVGEPAILVGHSLGGMTAVYAAAERPDLVAAAFLVDPPLYAPEVGLREEKDTFMQRRALAGKPVEDLLAAGLSEVQALPLSKFDGAALGYVLDGMFSQGWDTDALLRRIECPVLLEHGERGVGSGVAASALYEGEVERASRLIRNCRVVEIKGSGHIPMVQQPERFSDVLIGFIQEIVGRS